MLRVLFNPEQIALKNCDKAESTRESIIDLHQIGKNKKQSAAAGDNKEDHQFDDDDAKPPYLAAERFNVMAKVTDEDDFYNKENVEMMFLQLMADTNGDKMWEMDDKMKAIFGRAVFSTESNKGIKNAVDLHTTKIHQKLKIMATNKAYCKSKPTDANKD